MIDQNRILKVLHDSWSIETSTKWTAENPASGQCSVTALVVLDKFGGRLLKTRIRDAWHFYNEIAGEVFDFTAGQFSESVAYSDTPATVDEALVDTSGVQYQNLATAFARNWTRTTGK